MLEYDLREIRSMIEQKEKIRPSAASRIQKSAAT